MHQKTYGNIEQLCNLLNQHNFNIIFTFNDNAEARLIRKLTPKCKYFHLPHHIDTNIFKNYNAGNGGNRVNGGNAGNAGNAGNMNNGDNVDNAVNAINAVNVVNVDKDIDILLFGSVHPKHYPFRKRLFDLILNNKDKFPNVYFIEYDSTIFNPSHCESGLAKLLNRSKICIATKSRYDYMVGKYLEIPASNCLIAGDIPKDGRDLLKGNILELTNVMGDDEIISRLLECLTNYSNHTDKIEKIKNIVDTQYNLDMYIEKLLNIIL